MEELKRLVEQRQIEATLRKLTPKMMCILQFLGSPIICEGHFGSGIDQHFLHQPWLEYDEEEILTWEEGAEPTEMGQVFDTLSIGQNFEVKFNNFEKELVATYNGFLVYKETEGILRAYFPDDNWETLIDYFYEIAHKKEIKNKAEEKEKEKTNLLKDVSKFMKKLRETWGI